MWTLKLPLRIKLLCWLVIRNRILTKKNFKKKLWKNYLSALLIYTKIGLIPTQVKIEKL
jgi:hypothetical protein